MARKVLYCSSSRAPLPSIGDEVDLGAIGPPPSVQLVGDLLGCFWWEPWPPRLVQLSLEERGGRWIGRAEQGPGDEKLFGPRASEVHALIDRLGKTPWSKPGLSSDELCARARPHVDAFIAGIRRTAPIPDAEITFIASLAKIRGISRPPADAHAMKCAIVADTKRRIGAPRQVGAMMATCAAVARMIAGLAESLFRSGVAEFPTAPDAQGILRALGVELTLEDRIRIAHEATDLPAKALASIILECVIDEKRDALGTMEIPQRRVAEVMLNLMRETYPETEHSAAELHCAAITATTSWAGAGVVLEGMTVALSTHVASLVMLPKGAFDLFAPWADLITLGIPVFGHVSPTEFAFFSSPSS